MVSEKYFEAQHSNKISHFFSKVNNINPCFLQTSRIVFCNNINTQMKNPIKIFNLNPNSTKATVRNFNYTIKSEIPSNKFNCMLNFNKGFFNSNNNNNIYNNRNFNETNYFDLKSFPSDNITFYNKSHDFKNSNSIIKKFNQNNNNLKGFDFSSTRNSNMTSINYKTQIFVNNTKDGNDINKAQNSMNIDKFNEKSSNSKIHYQNNSLNNSSNLKNLNKKKNKGANINDIIRSIYDYSDVSMDNSSSFNHRKNIDKIIDEKSPVNNKILMKHNERNFFPNTQKDQIENDENNRKMIKLSLMEKYLISTDYSMNLTYKMR